MLRDQVSKRSRARCSNCQAVVIRDAKAATEARTAGVKRTRPRVTQQPARTDGKRIPERQFTRGRRGPLPGERVKHEPASDRTAVAFGLLSALHRWDLNRYRWRQRGVSRKVSWRRPWAVRSLLMAVVGAVTGWEWQRVRDMQVRDLEGLKLPRAAWRWMRWWLRYRVALGGQDLWRSEKGMPHRWREACRWVMRWPGCRPWRWLDVQRADMGEGVWCPHPMDKHYFVRALMG